MTLDHVYLVYLVDLVEQMNQVDQVDQVDADHGESKLFQLVVDWSVN